MTLRGELLAQRFHEAYERLAPEHGYRTREASAVPWADVPANNKALMVATADAVMDTMSCERPEYYTDPPADWGIEAQRVAEDHLNRCDEWMEYEDESGEAGNERPAGEDPSFGPYDGCQTCVVREALFAALPFIEEGISADLRIEVREAHMARIEAQNPGIDMDKVRAQSSLAELGVSSTVQRAFSQHSA